MPKVQKLITTHICDRCGSKHDPEKYTDGHRWGQTDLKWILDTGSRDDQGNAAGNSFEGESWLCMLCSEAFLQFMDGQSIVKLEAKTPT